MKKNMYYLLFPLYALVLAFILYINGVFTGEVTSVVNVLINVGFLLVIGILLFLLRVTGMTAHIAIAVAGILVLAVYTAATKKEWKIPVLEILMRAFYGIALVTGAIVLSNKITALAIVHKASAALFVVLLIVLFVTKLRAKKA